MKQTLKNALLTFVVMLLGVSAFAQVTTSSLSGNVTDQSGAPLPGAVVTAVHTPSGSQYFAVANSDGRYTINGMRAGGPYTVTFSCLSFKDVTVTDVVLQLAETYSLKAALPDDSQMLTEAVVISEAKSKFAAEKTGAATNITNKDIESLPTVSRSITDVTRLSPYGGNGMSFAGADGRTANFTVDGANFNNNFGLSDKLPGGGTPISIDAIEELQVVISPYDVRQTNFIGGGVNAITKSGTNTFKGTAYVYHKNENLRGDSIEGEQIPSARAIDRNTIYGFTLGGPIIKNKLFFFVNAEYAKTPSIANRWQGAKDGQKSDANQYISRTTQEDLETVKQYVASKYGYDTGSYTDFPADESNFKVLARIDWNISDAHKLAVRYNYTKNAAWNAPNATSMDGGTRASNARMSQYSMSFANSMYSMNNVVNSVSVDLNSRLSNNLSNQFLATFSKLDDLRGTNSAEFPFIDILDGGKMGIDGVTPADGTDNYMALGYELFTWNNAVHNTVANIKDDLTYYVGDHKITAGLSYEYQMADNAYMRNGSGYYRYSSLNDFLTGAAPEVVCLTYGYDGEAAPAARVQFHKAGLYAQDDWNITPNFKLTAGIRFDGLFFDNGDLKTNNAIYELEYDDRNGGVRHIDTGAWPNSNVTVSPRVGFSWDVFGDKSLKVRGGTGFFSGRLPLVFFTNMPTNAGTVQYQAQINAKSKFQQDCTINGVSYAKGDLIPMSLFAGGLATDANGNATTAALQQKLEAMGFPTTYGNGTVPSSISAVDPSFKMPQVWKTSLAVDYSLPTSFPLTISAEGIFNKTINGVTISDWSIIDASGFARYNGVDNRPIFPETFRSGTKAFVLENTNRGYGYSANVTINARPTKNLSLMAAYTHTVSRELTGMPGSAAESAFAYVPATAGPNNLPLHNSANVTPDRVVASLGYHDNSGNHYSFIYEAWRGGYNYSFMTVNDMNKDGYNYDAIFIPTDDQVASKEFRFVSEDDAARFMDFVHNNSYLSKHQGEYAEAYSFYSPWVNRIDFSYKHDFSVKVAGQTNTLQLSLDVKNLLNMFNSSWGVSKYLNPAIGSDPRILKYEGIDNEGYATFSTPKAINGTVETFVPSHSLGQCWYASVGIKYLFN